MAKLVSKFTSTINIKCDCGFIFTTELFVFFQCPNCKKSDIINGWILNLESYDYDFNRYLDSFKHKHKNRYTKILQYFQDSLIRFYDKDTSLVLEAQNLIGKNHPSNFRVENLLILNEQQNFVLLEIRWFSYSAFAYGFIKGNTFYYWNNGRSDVNNLGNFMNLIIIKEMCERKIKYINAGIMNTKFKPLMHYEIINA